MDIHQKFTNPDWIVIYPVDIFIYLSDNLGQALVVWKVDNASQISSSVIFIWDSPQDLVF